MGSVIQSRVVAVSAAALVSLWVWGAMDASALMAQEPPAAQDLVQTVNLDKHTFLKRLSLDLMGTSPQWDQYEALAGLDDVPVETIDEMLDSEAFLQSMVRYHRDLLWSNVTYVQFIQIHWELQRTEVGPPQDRHTVHWLSKRSYLYRGGPADTNESFYIPCGHWPATFDDEGNLEVECDEETGRCVEGWVWAEPYFAPGTEIKICGFDALPTVNSADGETYCGSPESSREKTCSCGPDLRFCDYNFDGLSVQLQVAHSIVDQVMQLIRHTISEGKPYYDILKSRHSFVNGPLAHFYKYQTELGGGQGIDPPPINRLFLPDIPWEETETWLPILQSEEHSGVLTAYSFLFKFSTNRGRANRFYNAFLDSSFDASKGIDSPDCVANSANLSKMCGCQRCHVSVEPMASYWGRWKQQGMGYLSPDLFPEYDDVCGTCGRNETWCPNHCRTDYVLEKVPADRIPYIGFLRGYEFLTEEDRDNVLGGPRLLVERTIQDGSLAHGLVSKMWKEYMRRDLTASKADKRIRDDLVRVLIESDYNLKVLIKAIVTLPAYRRIK